MVLREPPVSAQTAFPQALPLIGTTAIRAAESMPGSAARRARRSRCAWSRPSTGRPAWPRSMPATMTPSPWKPGSTLTRFCRLRANRNAPTSSTSESATWQTTSARRTPTRSRPVVRPRPLILRTLSAPIRVAFSAGARPKITHVPIASAAVNPSTRQSRPRSRTHRLVGRGDERHQGRAERAGQERAEGRARPGEQQALGEQLPDDATARGAEAETHRHLALPRARPGEQQVGEVRARDHEDERRGPEQQPQRRLVALAQRRDAGARVEGRELEAEVLRHADGGVVRRERRPEEIGRDGGELRGRLLDGPPGLEPSHHGQPPVGAGVEDAAAAVEDRLGAEWHRDVERSAHFEPEEPRLRDADNLDRLGLERQRAADDRPIAAVLALPERVAEDRARRAAAAIVGVGQDPAGRRPHAERVEEPAADPEALRGTRLAAGCEVEGRGSSRQQAREALLPRANLFPDRIGQRGIPAVEVAAHAGGIDETYLGEFGRVGHGQRAQPDRVDDLEDGGVRADAERERQDGDRREPRIPAEEPQAVAQVLRQPLEPQASPHLARDLLDRGDVADLAPRGGLGLRARLAAVHAIADRHLEVRADFLAELVVSVAPPEPGRHASLRFPLLRIPPIASTSWAHFDRSDASWRRPAAVSR